MSDRACAAASTANGHPRRRADAGYVVGLKEALT